MKRTLITGTVTITLILALTVVGFVAYGEQTKHIAEEAATYLAAQRNECRIERIVPRADKFELEVIVGLRPKVQPEQLDTHYDRLGLDATFWDEEPGDNSLTGLVARNASHKSDPTKTMESQGQSGLENSIILTLVITNDRSLYEILRKNTVNYTVTGPFVKDASGRKTVLVVCGTFFYNPTTRIVQT